ncbi:MAG: siderophore-interacting protein [Pseudomonadota bacterium]
MKKLLSRVPKRTPKMLEVVGSRRLTPNMIRVTFSAGWVRDLEEGIEGAHCKLFFPKPDQSPEDFVAAFENGPRPDVRTYTLRFVRPRGGEIDIDFVDHGDAGPASAWARQAKAGDVCGFGGPGPVKMNEFFADTYILAADMSALPVASAALEAMPRDAKGVAYFEITDPEDKQLIDAPKGVEVHWLIHHDVAQPHTQAVALIEALPAFRGTVQTCIAGESAMITALRQELIVKRGLTKRQAYIAGYWKIGLIEDEHQKVKRADAA